MHFADLSLSSWILLLAAIGAGIWVHRVRKMARLPPGPKGISALDDLSIASHLLTLPVRSAHRRKFTGPRR